MSDYFVIKNIDKERWYYAQNFEKMCWKDWAEDSEDWNSWWMEKFDNYSFLKNYKIESILEVGCGPWAKNTLNVINVIGEPKKIFLEDPLLNDYISQNKSVKKISATKISAPLEELELNEQVDLLICINVFDHVYSTTKCMQAICKSLKPNGIIIFANDLTNEQDYIKTPIADVGHPIRLDLECCESFMKPFEKIFIKILEREEGRNPPCHHGTFLFSGLKK